ncbi:TraX protein [Butyrivibrio proteoclasticus]|uniref:TraX protein n=1 Tax=Butyrivibrio proteoclasticus TaxID=43305 RepID=A0A1I5X5B7_9FIRM|nr:TraX family protein [Butyrivibrio proteoclasticus]SFQ27169.1 TraX protein [Butyrivibrio proteoclasticus]
MNLNLDKYRKLNGNTLKIIACICMLIDHIGAAIILPVYQVGVQKNLLEFDKLNMFYKAMRFVGRSAFPIFAFLLVEGFIHTKNRLRYALSLFIFAIISEYPYDLAFNKADKNFMYSANVMFSLLIGLLVIWAVDFFRKELSMSGKKISRIALYPASALVIAIGAYTAHVINCDYREFGIGVMLIFYFFRFYESVSIPASYILLCGIANEFKAFPGFILLFFYNKKRGRDLGKLKYLFYIFYPAHLLLLYAIRYAIYKI